MVSVLKGTLRAFCTGLRIDVQVESDEDPERVREMVQLAWNGCWTVQALVQKVDVSYQLEVTPADR